MEQEHKTLGAHLVEFPEVWRVYVRPQENGSTGPEWGGALLRAAYTAKDVHYEIRDTILDAMKVGR